MPTFQPSALPAGAYRVSNKNHDYWIVDADGNIIGQTGANGQDTFFAVATQDAGTGATTLQRGGTTLKLYIPPALKEGRKLVDWTLASNAVISDPLAASAATITKSEGVKTTFSGAPTATQSLGATTTLTSTDLTDGDTLILDVGLPVDACSCSLRVTFYTAGFARGANFAVVLPYNAMRYPRMQFVIPMSEAAAVSGFTTADWAAVTYVNVDYDKAAGSVTNASESLDLYSLWIGRRALPNVFFAIDDNNRYLNRFFNGFRNPKGMGLPEYNIKPIVYCIATQIGQPGYATLADMQKVYAAGWDIGVHGTTALVNPIASIAWAAGTATVTTVFAHGYSNGDTIPLSGCDPYVLNGSKVIAGAAGSTFTFTTGVPGGTGSSLGNMSIPWKAGSGNANATTAAAIQAEIAALRSAGVTRGLSHYAFPNGAWSRARVTELEGLGFRTFRTTAGLVNTTVPTTVLGDNGGQRSAFPLALGLNSPSTMFSTVDMNENPALTVAGAVARKDMAVRAGNSIMFYGHTISVLGDIVSNNTEWEAAKFWQLCDAIVADRASGVLDTSSFTSLLGD